MQLNNYNCWGIIIVNDVEFREFRDVIIYRIREGNVRCWLCLDMIIQ